MIYDSITNKLKHVRTIYKLIIQFENITMILIHSELINI